MRFLRALFLRSIALFRNDRRDADFAEEIEIHLQMQIEHNLRSGMSEEESRRAALIKLGGAQQAKEDFQQRRTLPLIETLWADIRFGVRTLRHNPGFTFVAIATLALGIAGNTAIFSIVNGVLLNPLPFPHPEQLVALSESKPNFSQGSISYPNFLDWQKDNHTFSAMALARPYAFSLTGRGDAEQVNAEFVSGDFFPILGVNPILGRTFTGAEEQPGAGPVALISEGLWRRKFNSAPDILGKAITLDGRDFTIIGIISSKFHLTIPSFHEQEVYAPIRQYNNPGLLDRGAGLWFHGIGRLKPGVTLEQARADMDRVTQNLAAAYPAAEDGIGANLVPLKERMVGNLRPFLLVLLAAVAFVLLIACVNVASLLLARSSGRSREFAVRAALGASRQRIIRQLLTESILLGLVAGVAGLLLSVWAVHAALNLLPASVPRAEEIGLDLRVLSFTAVISLLAGSLFGLVPALKTSQSSPQSALKEGARGVSTKHRALNIFVVAEMAIALVLLIGAGLMVRSLTRLWNIDPGFNPRNLLTFGISLPPSMTSSSPDQVRAAFRDLDANLAATPGVKALSQSWGAVPMSSDDEQLFWLDGQPRPTNQSAMSWALGYIVESDYLNTMGIALRRGRFFSPHDDEHSPAVAVIDDVFAAKYFPNQDPIGKRIDLLRTGAPVEIIGVVDHVHQWGLDLDDTQSLRAQIYLPCMQLPDRLIANTSGSTVLVRYEGSTAAVLEAIRATSRRMSSQQVIFGALTMEKIISDSLATRRFVMILLGAFAALALILASVGIYGVIAYVVGQRTQEIGIRMALGARREDVLRLILWQGTRLALVGICIGIAGAFALTRLMTKLLYGVSPTDPLTLAALALFLAAIATAACGLPARRAMRVDPIVALRSE